MAILNDVLKKVVPLLEAEGRVEVEGAMAKVRKIWEFRLRLYTRARSYVHSPVLFTFVDWSPDWWLKLFAGPFLDRSGTLGEDEFRDKALKIVPGPHDQVMAALRRTGVKFPWVQAIFIGRSDQQVIWMGQLTNAAVINDDEEFGFKTYDMRYDGVTTLAGYGRPPSF